MRLLLEARAQAATSDEEPKPKPPKQRSSEANAEVLRQLMKANADSNLGDAQDTLSIVWTTCIEIADTTPLIEAVRFGDLEVCRLLLDRGADAQLRGAHGLSAVDLAWLTQRGSWRRLALLCDDTGRLLRDGDPLGVRRRLLVADAKAIPTEEELPEEEQWLRWTLEELQQEAQQRGLRLVHATRETLLTCLHQARSWEALSSGDLRQESMRRGLPESCDRKEVLHMLKQDLSWEHMEEDTEQLRKACELRHFNTAGQRKAPKASAKSSATRQAPRNVREVETEERLSCSRHTVESSAKPALSMVHVVAPHKLQRATVGDLKATRKIILANQMFKDKGSKLCKIKEEDMCILVYHDAAWTAKGIGYMVDAKAKAAGKEMEIHLETFRRLADAYEALMAAADVEDAVHQEGCNVPVSNQPQASVPQGVPSRTPEALVRPQKPRPPPEEVTLLRRMLREHRQAQLDSSPRSTGTPRRQEATQAWPSILQRRSLQRPMYPMWRPSRRPSPQWRDVGMPNVQQPFLADALQHRSAASRPASPPQPIHRQRGLQEAQERLHEAKAYQELLELQEIQRRLQHMGLEEAQVVNEHPAAASGGSSFRSWMPERPVEKSPDMPNVRFPQAAGDGPQWGDLQLQLHEQLETLRQKLRSHSTKELKTEAIKADRSLEAQAGFAEFMKRQHDSLAERLFQSGFIPELNASSGSMSTVLPTGRHESEDTEQRESEPASPELSQLLHPAAAPVEAQRKAQRPQYFQLSPDTSQNILQDSNSPSFDGFEAYQQPFVLSPCGHAGRASSPASGLSEKEVQLDSSPRRRSLQRPMYPMWRPSRRPSPQWRDVGMPNVQQPFLADALQSPSCINAKQGWACRSASPPQQLHQQLGHLQQVEEQLHKLKEPTRRRDVHQVYQELLQLQEIQRSLQHLGLEEEHVVTSEQSPAASCGGNNSASFTPEQLVEMEKLTGTPSVPFPRFGAGEGPQWGDLQLRLLQQLEMLQQKQPTQSTKEVQTDPAEDEDGPESESQAEFMKRQHDSLAERLFQSGFIPELNASSGSMSTVLPTGRHESEDTEQRESEPASPELSQLSRPSALAAGPKAQAQQKAERSSDGNIVQDSKLRSSHGTQESDSLSFDRFEVCQQSFVLSPSGHVRTASSPASGGLAEKEEAQYSIFCGMAA
ncbi:unnamed protein product, partial [Durusdinium trenchii]